MAVDILLIDDNVDHLEVSTQFFTHHEYSVQTLSEPLDALQKIKEINPRLLILDIMMPGMDGFTLLNQIKNEPLLDQLPVIILSGKNFPPERKKAMHLGAKRYLTKPIHSSKLLNEVRQII